ncbi:phosphatase PAP2 family protein [Anaerospora hongkongensis]|uniref:phosphatase PAP2 family protein n=1 Tax=Anaerospora hongkongensis TaxID=244830 RepID=UPI0028A1AE3B|nr:phosphatase PAP2 family protein [Anaerospora hongkongensis]
MISLKRFISILLLCLLGSSFAAAEGRHTEKVADIFVHKSIRIEADQRIGRLLVAQGDALVYGTVHDGIVVVDGNVVLGTGAKVKGGILILGGRITEQNGAQTEGSLLVTGPVQVPIVNWLVGGILLVTLFGLLVLPYVVLLILRYAESIPIYSTIKKKLLHFEHHWPVLAIILALAVSGSMLVVFFELTWKTIFRQTMGLFDNTVIWLVRYFATEQLDPVMITITNLGYGFTYGVIVVCSFLILLFYRRWLEFAGLALCLAGGALLNSLLKNLFERSRPDQFTMVVATGYSFPSGHAMVSLCFYGMLAFLIARRVKKWQYRYGIAILTMFFIAAIGVSRIYLGVHYPSDITAGFAAGAVWLTFTISLMWWWEEQRRVKEIDDKKNNI